MFSSAMSFVNSNKVRFRACYKALRADIWTYSNNTQILLMRIKFNRPINRPTAKAMPALSTLDRWVPQQPCKH